MDELLAKYAREKDSAALARLIQAHIGWVYAAAARQVRDVHLAEDVTQAVFLLLARKAASMSPDTRLTGWLFNALRYISRDALKLQRRRERHERQVADARVGAGKWWEEAAPVLDEAVGRLARVDRELVLGRFYRDQTYEQLAGEVNLSAEAVRKRIGRALQELRGYLEAKAGELPEELDGLLQAKVGGAVAPEALVAATIASAGAASGGSAAVAALVTKAAKGMAWVKAKVLVATAAGVVIVGTAAGVAVQRAGDAASQAGATQAVAPMPAEAPTPAIMPTIAATPQREAGAYVSFSVVVDEPLLEEMRAEAGRSVAGGSGSELLVLDGRQVNRILLARRGNGVLADAGDIMCRTDGDASRQWSLVTAYPSVVQAKFPDGRTTAEIEHRATYQTAISGKQVRVVYAGWARSRMLRVGAGQQSGAFSPQQVYEISNTLAVGQAAVYAVPAYAQGNERIWLLWIIQTVGADELDVRQLRRMARVSTVDWLKEDPARMLVEARRAVLWDGQLPKSYMDKWYWALPDGGGVKLRAITDPSISKVMAWAPDGGRAEYRSAEVSSMNGTMLHYESPGGYGQAFLIPAGTRSLRVGSGHGSWRRIIDAPLADVIEQRVEGRLYRVKRYDREGITMEWDNDPTIDTCFYAVDANGKMCRANQNERGRLWREKDEGPGRKGPGTIGWLDDTAKRIVVEVRPRLWHTFDGISTKPATPAPDDAQVLASFAKPLDLPIPPRDADETPDMFTQTRASTIYFDLTSPAGLAMRWFGDAAGRFYSEGQGHIAIYDGARALWWTPDESRALTSRQAPDLAFAPKLSLLHNMCVLADRYEPKPEDPEEMIGGVKTRLTRGALKDVPNMECKVWRDLTGRLVRLEMGTAAVLNVRYNLPDDPRWFSMDPEDVAKSKDIEAAEPIVQKLCDRPAIAEVTDGGRVVRLHEVTPGPDGMVYVCYSTQLLPKAAAALRNAPYAMWWGRGNIGATWDDALRPYSVTLAGYIHTADRSITWAALTPNPECQRKGPWLLHLNLQPLDTRNALPTLAAAGFKGFSLVDIPLPAVDPAKAVAPQDWLTGIHDSVWPYIQAATVLEVNGAPLVQPGRTMKAAYIKETMGKIEAAKAAKMGSGQGLCSF